jgi:hypothetical protein
MRFPETQIHAQREEAIDIGADLRRRRAVNGVHRVDTISRRQAAETPPATRCELWV